MTSEISSFISQLKQFNEYPSQESKLLAGITREADQSIFIIVLMLPVGDSERFKIFWLKKNGIEDGGLYEMSTTRMQTFDGGVIEAVLMGKGSEKLLINAKPVTGNLRETIANPASAEQLVEAMKEQNHDLIFRLSEAGVPVFKQVWKSGRPTWEDSTYPTPLRLI
jgi:hypothetical protein